MPEAIHLLEFILHVVLCCRIKGVVLEGLSEHRLPLGNATETVLSHDCEDFSPFIVGMYRLQPALTIVKAVHCHDRCNVASPLGCHNNVRCSHSPTQECDALCVNVLLGLHERDGIAHVIDLLLEQNRTLIAFAVGHATV